MPTSITAEEARRADVENVTKPPSSPAPKFCRLDKATTRDVPAGDRGGLFASLPTRRSYCGTRFRRRTSPVIQRKAAFALCRRTRNSEANRDSRRLCMYRIRGRESIRRIAERISEPRPPKSKPARSIF